MKKKNVMRSLLLLLDALLIAATLLAALPAFAEPEETGFPEETGVPEETGFPEETGVPETDPEETGSKETGFPEETDPEETDPEETDEPNFPQGETVPEIRVPRPVLTIGGPTSARAGDTVTLTVSLDADGAVLYGLQTDPVYDASQAVIADASSACSWTLKREQRILVTDDELERPVTGSTRLFTVRLALQSTLKEGDVVQFRLTGNVVTDWEDLSDVTGVRDLAIPDAVLRVTVLAPREEDATLRELRVAEGSFSPAFYSAHLDYSMTVPYAVRSLTLTALPTSDRASVRVTGNTLQVGGNTVVISVTAENGIVWIYRLFVTRGSDPDYVPSADASLSAIRLTCDGGVSVPVSPLPGTGQGSGQDDGQTEFVAYLPFEAEVLTVTPVPASPTASAEPVVVTLAEGVNEVPFRVAAEDGTAAEYVLYAVRMPAFRGAEDLPDLGAETVPAETEPSETALPETDPPSVTEPGTQPPDLPGTEPSTSVPPVPAGKSGISPFWLIPAAIAGGLAVYGVIVLLKKKDA